MRATVGAAIVLAACSAGPKPETPAVPVLLFAEGAEPACKVEKVRVVSATITMNAAQKAAAEEALQRRLRSSAAKLGADAVINYKLVVQDKVPFTVPGGKSPSENDLPNIPWQATGEAVRFVDGHCRS